MNKTELVINGIRARTFKSKRFKNNFHILNDLIILKPWSRKKLPETSNKITIKPRHTKFKYSKNAIRTGLSIWNSRIYKMYFFKTYKNMFSETDVTTWINKGGIYE